jgi:hypothetical protein
MLRRLAFFCLVAAALAACASIDPARDTRAWFFNTDGEVKLAYGTPQSDDVALMLSCEPRSGRVAVSQSALRPGDGVTLTSGGRRTTFYGEAEPDQLNGGVFVTAETSAAAPVLAAFRDTGRIGVVEDGRAAELYATPAERMQIQQFFGACSA